MGVGSTNRRNDYIGTGLLDTYSYTFRILRQQDIEVISRVIASGVETTLALTTDYTVTGVKNASGGTVVLVAGVLASTKSLTIRLKPEITQIYSFRNEGDFFPENHEDAIDRAVQICLRQQDEIDRSFKLPSSLDPDDYETEITPVASTYLGFDASMNLTTLANLSSYTVSAFIATLLDDATAAAARGTLDAARLTSSQTAETTPAVGDLVSIIDVSEGASAENSMTLANLFKVIGGLDVMIAADLSVADAVAAYRADTGTAERIPLPNLASAGRAPSLTHNVGIIPATTTNANDSVKITGSNGSALAANANLGYVTIPDASNAGRLTRLQVNDITLLLTGAHGGLGTLGDAVDIRWHVYLINDAGTLKAGVSRTGGYTSITTALSSQTQTSVDSLTKMLVNSTLTGTSNCVEIGTVLTDFDDTGGAAEDLFVVQSALGEICVGPRRGYTPPTVQRFTSGSGTYTTPTGPLRPLYLKVKMAGGGGGGGGSGTAAGTAATAGGNTTFGTSTAAGGGAGPWQAAPAAGGTATVGAGHVNLASQDGTKGGGYGYNGTGDYEGGTDGGSTPHFGGAGRGGSVISAGNAATANSGSGGGGGGTNNTNATYAGQGGASGAFCEFIVPSPNATYAYAVGAAGAAGAAGANGNAGAAGAAGIIIVEEHYQ